MGLIAKIVWTLLEFSPQILEIIRRMDSERNAKLVVEEAERAVEREIAQRGFDAAMEDSVRAKVDAAREHAANAVMEAKIREMEGFR